MRVRLICFIGTMKYVDIILTFIVISPALVTFPSWFGKTQKSSE